MLQAFGEEGALNPRAGSAPVDLCHLFLTRVMVLGGNSKYFRFFVSILTYHSAVWIEAIYVYICHKNGSMGGVVFHARRTPTVLGGI